MKNTKCKHKWFGNNIENKCARGNIQYFEDTVTILEIIDDQEFHKENDLKLKCWKTQSCSMISSQGSLIRQGNTMVFNDFRWNIKNTQCILIDVQRISLMFINAQWN